MSQDQTNPLGPEQPWKPAPQPAKPDVQPPEPPKPRRRRRWPWVILVLFLLLIGLVVLAPTIASIGPVRSIVLGKVNENLNGRVEVADWSLGWFSPISASGIKVYDEKKELVLDIPRIKLGLSLLDAVRSNFNLGDDNVIDVDNFVVTLDEKGETNLQRLPRAHSSKPRTPSKEGNAPIKLPDISGKFTVNFKGTVQGSAVPQPLHVDPSSAVVTISHINKPIESSVKLTYHIGDGPQSVVATSGSISAVENNVLDLAKFAGGQKIDLSNVNLAALQPFMIQPLGQDVKLEGIVTGGIDIKAEGLSGLTADGKITIANLLFSGGPLGKDQFITRNISIPVKITRTSVSPTKNVIKFENVGVAMDQMNVNIAGELTQESLVNLSEGKPPGDTGSITLRADITDLANLSKQLKNTLHLQEGVEITGGSVHQQLNITLDKDKVTVAQNLTAEAQGKSGNQQIKLQPITVTASAAGYPTGKSVPDIRDIKLAVGSDFFKLQGGGESLAKVNITGNVELDKLRNEVGQFIDLKKLQLQGSGDFAINTTGDVTDSTKPIAAKATLTLANVRVSGVSDQQMNQDRLAIVASATLDRAKNVINDVLLTVQSGDSASPLLNVEAAANGVNLTGTPSASWELRKLDITDLAKLQSQYGGFVPALDQQKLKIAGAIHASGAGTYSGTTTTITKPLALAMSSLVVNKDNRLILPNETIRTSLAGSFSTGSTLSANLSDLSLNSDSKLINVSKTGDAPLIFSMTSASGAITGSGVLSLAADLKRLADLAQAFGGQVVVQPNQPQLSSGQFSGTITLARADQTSIDFNGQISGLTVMTNGKNALENEKLTITLNAKAPSDFKAQQPIAADAKIGSSFLNATVSGAKIAMAGGLFDKLQAVDIDAQIPSLVKLDALRQAFTPPSAVKAADQTGNRPNAAGDAGDAVAALPIEITNGSAAVKLSVARDTNSKTTTLNVSDLRVNQLALHRGRREYSFDKQNPITFKLTAAVQTSDKQEIQSIKVNQLTGDLRVASLDKTQDIVINNPMGAQPTYDGGIKITGSIDAAKPLLAVLQDSDLPYAGQYQIVQNIKTQDALTKLDGSIDITKFQVLGDKPSDVRFSEDQVAIRNGVDLDLTNKNASVRTLTVDMPKSQALGVKFNGQVLDWANARTIQAAGASGPAKLDLTYDLEKVWAIIKPMLSTQAQQDYKDLKLQGKYTKSFTISGSYPNKPTYQQSLATLNADGSLAVDLVDTPYGLTIRSFELPFTIKNGVFQTKAAPQSDARKIQIATNASSRQRRPAADQSTIIATTGVINDGVLNLDQVTLDLTQPDPVLSMTRRHVLLRGVKLNQVLAENLGKMGAVVFTGSSKAEGLLTMTVSEMNRVPLGELLQKKQDARAEITIAVDDLLLDGFLPQILAASHILDLGTEGIQGNIPPSTITINKGQAQTDLTVQIAKMVKDSRTGQDTLHQAPLKFSGGVGLEKLDLRDFVITVPPELMLAEIRKALPNGAVIPLKGTSGKYRLDTDKLLQENLLRNLIGGQGGKGNDSNPLGGILDQIGGGGDKPQQNPNPPRQQNPPRPRNTQPAR